jgi:hypothetical protein
MRKPIVGKILSLTTLLATITATTSFGPVLIGLLSSTAGLAQVPAGITGTWNVTSSLGNADRQDQIQLVMVLHQNGSEITGSIGPSAERQVLTISNGRIEGNNVSLDIGNEQAKINVQFQLEAGKAEGRFRTSNQQGVTIQGTGNGQVQADRMTFQWSATRGDQRLQGKLELTKAEK